MSRRNLYFLAAAVLLAVTAMAAPAVLSRVNAGQTGVAGEPTAVQPPQQPPVKAKAPTTPEQRMREAEAMARVKRMILDGYVEEVDEKKLFYGAMRGMFHELDPHSTFFTPEEYQDLTASTSGKFGGLGIEVTIKDSWLTVVTPLFDSPAFKAGVLPGDKIVRIDGTDTEAMTLEEAVHKMRGKPGAKVVLTIARKGEGKLLDVPVVRQIINVESVRIPHMIDQVNKIGYVSVTSFQEKTDKELAKALDKLEKEGMKGLVLDLRVNGGGVFDAAIGVADLFLDKGVIVSVRSRTGEPRVYSAAKSGTHPDYPMILLVNESSASASEIVAGALRDHHRAVLVGEKTYGKGSVQTVRDVRIGDEIAGLKLTTAHYYTPSGQCIHKIGIEPDIKVTMEPEVLAEVMKRQHDKWVEQNAPKAPAAEKKPEDAKKPAEPVAEKKNPASENAPDASTAKTPAKAADTDKDKFVDLQLEAGLTALRAMMVDRDRNGPVRKYDPAEDKKAAAAKATKPAPDPAEELVPVD